MKLKIQKGDKISVKIGKRFKKHEVVLYDPSEGWIVFKSTEKNKSDFVLNTKIHTNHIKILETKSAKSPPKKRGRKKKK